MSNREFRWSEVTADWLGGVAVVGGAFSVISQQGRGGGGVSADDQLQAVWRLCDERNHKAAVKVSGPDVVNLGETTRRPLASQAAPRVWAAVGLFILI